MLPWIIAIIATIIYSYFIYSSCKAEESDNMFSLGIDIFIKIVKIGFITLLYAIFWIIWLIIF